jgi:hypothetical protein
MSNEKRMTSKPPTTPTSSQAVAFGRLLSGLSCLLQCVEHQLKGLGELGLGFFAWFGLGTNVRLDERDLRAIPERRQRVTYEVIVIWPGAGPAPMGEAHRLAVDDSDDLAMILEGFPIPLA